MTWPQERFAYLFFAIYLCLFVHIESLNDFDKAALVAKVEADIGTQAQKTFCLLDSDHDGILTIEEAVQEIARRLGADPEEFHILWDEEHGSWDSCWNGSHRKPGFWQHWASGVYAKFAGRIDWTPCMMSLWTRSTLRMSPDKYDEDDFYSESVANVEQFEKQLLVFTRIMPITEMYKFRTEMDTDGDGCLSKEEYDYFRRKRYQWSPYINFTTITEFSAIEEYIQLPRKTSSVLEKNSCVDEVAWQMWSLEAISDSLVDGSHANQSCKTQTPIHTEMDQNSMNLTLVIVLGCCGLVAIVAISCLALYRYRNRQYRVNLDQAKQVQKLLKAKIDAWSIFDASLCTKTCDLEPSFMHSLGLQGYQPETLNLIKIAHPEDAGVLQDMLAQLERDLDSGSLPKMTNLRFVYGEIDNAHKKHYASVYVPVELLMAWGSGARSTVLVGITMLGEAPSARSLPSIGTDDAPDVEVLYNPRDASFSEAAASVHSHGEFILNGSDVVSCGVSEAETFRSMTANGHRGGQITKVISDMKTGQIRDVFGGFEVTSKSGLASDAVPEKTPQQVSTSASADGSQDTSKSSPGTTSL